MSQKRKPILLIIAAGVIVVGGLALASMISPRKGYAPEQPIYFRHKRMAGKPNWVQQGGKEVNLGGFNIPCRYCHNMAYKGRHSTLPSTEICMNCHKTVGQDKEWVLVLKGYWERGEPIPWVKVHDLPDFVYFDHSVHLNSVDQAGRRKIGCTNCHGDVAEMDVVSVQNRFNMGWCLDCHRDPNFNGPTDCITCHR